MAHSSPLLSSSPASSPSRSSLLAILLLGLGLLFTGAFIQSQVFPTYSAIAKRSIDVPDGLPRSKRPFKQRWVHLDLKGAPPRVSFLRELLPMLQRLGVRGLLVEWEDTFPYEGRLKVLRAAHGYSRADVREILGLAAASSLEVVPLIQSFGHLEFVLKHDRFAHLRERVTEESSICPSRNESLPLIRDIIKQMRALHPASTRIHIGADEAYYVGEDVHCRLRLEKSFKNSTERLKLDHIARVARTALSEGFTEVLAWNDMFDRASVEMMREASLGSLITPVVWGYAADVTKEGYFPEGLFARLGEVFNRTWFASAFKGANGAGNVFIEVDRYLANQRSYARLYKDFEKDLSSKVEGIILTGWSRFSHRQPLCELLPSSIPSLVLDLIYLQDVTAEGRQISAGVKEFLSCPSTPAPGLYEPVQYAMEGQSLTTFYPPRERMFTQCSFPGKELFVALEELRFINWKAKRLNSRKEEERTEFNLKVEEVEGKLRRLLSALIFDDAVDEFINRNVRPLRVPRPLLPSDSAHSHRPRPFQ